MAKENEAIVMLEMAKAAHALNQQRPINFAVAKMPSQQTYAERPLSNDEYEKLNMEANTEFIKAVPLSKRLHIIYAPLVTKMLCSDICEQIKKLLSESKVTDTKKMTSYFRKWNDMWIKELHSQWMPEGTEYALRQLTQWWREDGTDRCVNALRYAYNNRLGNYSELSSNTKDFLAWIFTVRDLVRCAMQFDDRNLSYLSGLPQAKPYHLRRNPEDFSYKMEKFLTDLVESAFGKRVEIDDASIKTGRKALLNRLLTYDAFTNISEFEAMDMMEEAGQECLADRCKDCVGRDKCKALKAVVKRMSKSA